MNSTIIDIFNNYISCPIFQNELKQIEKKNGKLFKEFFEEESRSFVDYYLFSKPE